MNHFRLEDFLNSGALISLDQERLLVGWGPRKWGRLPDASENSYWYFPDFFLRRVDPWFTHAFQAIVPKEEFSKKILAPSEKTEVAWEAADSPLFFQMFDDLKSKIDENILHKGVPFSFQKSATRMSPQLLSHALNHLFDYIKIIPAHLYGFWDDRSGILGASPETLFKFDGPQVLQTMALAGTCKKGGEEALLQDPKIAREHRLVIKGIIEALFSFGILSIGKTTLQEFGPLCHLVTPIQAGLRINLSFDECVQILHPTPALGTYPRDAGDQWLIHWQSKIDRKRFGAPVGFVTEKAQEAGCYVGIRNIQWDKEGLAIGAGCGVVKDSRAEKEWEEAALKFLAIKKMMGL